MRSFCNLATVLAVVALGVGGPALGQTVGNDSTAPVAEAEAADVLAPVAEAEAGDVPGPWTIRSPTTTRWSNPKISTISASPATREAAERDVVRLADDWPRCAAANPGRPGPPWLPARRIATTSPPAGGCKSATSPRERTVTAPVCSMTIPTWCKCSRLGSMSRRRSTMTGAGPMTGASARTTSTARTGRTRRPSEAATASGTSAGTRATHTATPFPSCTCRVPTTI